MVENQENFGKEKNNSEEDFSVIAQRFLNIFRQLHIFTPERKKAFDDSVLALPPEIRGVFGKLIGGNLLQEYVDELEERTGNVSSRSMMSSKEESIDDTNIQDNNKVASASVATVDKKTEQILAKVLESTQKNAQAATQAQMQFQAQLVEALRKMPTQTAPSSSVGSTTANFDSSKIEDIIKSVVKSQSEIIANATREQTEKISRVISDTLKESYNYSTKSIVDALKLMNNDSIETLKESFRLYADSKPTVISNNYIPSNYKDETYYKHIEKNVNRSESKTPLITNAETTDKVKESSEKKEEYKQQDETPLDLKKSENILFEEKIPESNIIEKDTFVHNDETLNDYKIDFEDDDEDDGEEEPNQIDVFVENTSQKKKKKKKKKNKAKDIDNVLSVITPIETSSITNTDNDVTKDPDFDYEEPKSEKEALTNTYTKEQTYPLDSNENYVLETNKDEESYVEKVTPKYSFPQGLRDSSSPTNVETSEVYENNPNTFASDEYNTLNNDNEYEITNKLSDNEYPNDNTNHLSTEQEFEYISTPIVNDEHNEVNYEWVSDSETISNNTKHPSTEQEFEYISSPTVNDEQNEADYEWEYASEDGASDEDYEWEYVTEDGASDEDYEWEYVTEDGASDEDYEWEYVTEDTDGNLVDSEPIVFEEAYLEPEGEVSKKASPISSEGIIAEESLFNFDNVKTSDKNDFVFETKENKVAPLASNSKYKNDDFDISILDELEAIDTNIAGDDSEELDNLYVAK